VLLVDGCAAGVWELRVSKRDTLTIQVAPFTRVRWKDVEAAAERIATSVSASSLDLERVEKRATPLSASSACNAFLSPIRLGAWPHTASCWRPSPTPPRHGTGAARVEFTFGQAALQLTVSTPAAGDLGPRANGGHGLIGMPERATLLGGSLEAERSNGTFRVRARLPYRAHRP
jgi:hypothetical protein